MQPLAWLFPASVLLAAQTCEPPVQKKDDSEKSEKKDAKKKKASDKKDDAEVAEEKTAEKKEGTDTEEKVDADTPVKPLEVPIELDGLPGQLVQVPGTNIVLTTPYGADVTKDGVKLNEGKNFWLTFGQADTGLHVVFQNEGLLACNASTARTYSVKQIELMRKSCQTMREVTPDSRE